MTVLVAEFVLEFENDRTKVVVPEGVSLLITEVGVGGDESGGYLYSMC